MMKALFLHTGPEKTIEDVEQMAKKEALRIGFKDKEVIRVRLAEYKPQLKGWVLVVQNLW